LTEIPLCKALPLLEPPSRALGSLYVLEGATLGGQIISRHLQATLGLNQKRGAAFFNGYGSENGQMWREFGKTLTESTETKADPSQVLKGAEETFRSLEIWFMGGETRDA
jgi:heme oxygenase